MNPWWVEEPTNPDDILGHARIRRNRVTEYVDHLHEHFADPVRIRNAHYLLPEKPGYSAQIFPETLRDYSYPDGSMWQ